MSTSTSPAERPSRSTAGEWPPRQRRGEHLPVRARLARLRLGDDSPRPAAVFSAAPYSAGAKAWKKVGNVPSTPRPMRTKEAISSLRDSTARVR